LSHGIRGWIQREKGVTAVRDQESWSGALTVSNRPGIWINLVGRSGLEESEPGIKTIFDERVHKLLEHSTTVDARLLLAKLINKDDFKSTLRCL